MRSFKSILFAGLISTITLTGCGSIFGGKISDCQKHVPVAGQPKRQIRPAVLIADIITTPFIGLPIDFISGAIYKPCEWPKPVFDSVIKIRDKYRESISGRSKFFTIYNEPTQNLFCQDINIGIEHPISKNVTLGLDLATIHPLGAFYVNPFSAAQRDWPGTVYNGYAATFELKLFDNRKPSTYVGFMLDYKYLWYNNVPFYDIPPGWGDIGINYTRNETAHVYGLDVVFGHEFAFLNKAILIDYFFGLGLRYKTRDIYTYSDTYFYGGGNQNNGFVSPGYSTQHSFFPTPEIGIKFGLNTFRKTEGFPISIGQKPADDDRYGMSLEEIHRLDSATSYRKGLRIYTDAVQTTINEYNLGIEYAWNPEFTLGANFGISHNGPMSYLSDNAAYNTYYFPVLLRLTSGHTGRVFVKYYTKRNPRNYWCLQIVYKSLWLTSTDTYWWNGYGNNNVHSSIIGQDIINGEEFWSKNKDFFLDIYYGVGMRERYSDIYFPTVPGYVKSGAAFYPVPVLGINIGYMLFD